MSSRFKNRINNLEKKRNYSFFDGSKIQKVAEAADNK
jgi:prepilin-type processing-associated H-X9-DG protein